MFFLKQIDRFLNWITMYKLTLYFLIVLILAAILGSLLGFISYSPIAILIVVFSAVLACLISNIFFAKVFHAATNVESVFISALIISLIVPIGIVDSYKIAAVAGIIAMASKYLLTVEKRHVFNPAAIAMVVLSLWAGEYSARWWVGTSFMFPFVIAGGFLIARKTRREAMILSFIVVNLFLICAASFGRSLEIWSIFTTIQQTLIHSALIFFATIMLVEPLTSPTSKSKQIYFGIFVAFLHATTNLRLGIAFTPEMALCIGNIISYFMSPNYRLILSLKEKVQLTKDTVAFIFNSPTSFNFTPGQYLEWTLPHTHTDNRGNRRYFSLASSPTENTPTIVVKHYDPPSSYKKTLWEMPIGTKVIASQLSGDFVLPKDLSKPLVLIAGGVGFAPFRSMIKFIMDKNLKANITLLFANKTESDILYKDFLKDAENFGIKTVNILSEDNALQNWKGEKGHITSDMVKRLISDFKNVKYFISGPQLMVQSIEKTLRDTGISKKQIKTDFFPGYSV